MENGPETTQTTPNSVVTTQPVENGLPDSGPQTKQPTSNTFIIEQPDDKGYVDPGEVWLSNGVHPDPNKTNDGQNKKRNKKKRKKKREEDAMDSVDFDYKKGKRSIYSNYNPDPIIDDSGCDLLGLFCCVSCCSCDCGSGGDCCGDGCDIDLDCCD